MGKIGNSILVVCILLILFSCGQTPEITSLNPGDDVPDFSLVDRQGKTWKLSELKGQVVFINFWATWCGPCLRELPSMQKLYEKLPKDRFKMLTILNSDKPEMADFVTTNKKITIPVLDDSANEVGPRFFITGLPETFIVDKKGIVREKVIGGIQWDTPKYIQMIQGLINEPG